MIRPLSLWNKLKTYPGGPWLFSKFIAFTVPYTGSMGAKVLELKAGYCRMQLSDRHRVRNHLKSIHAIALANLGEATGGLALMSAIPENGRAIIIKLSFEYLKKARGTLISEAEFTLPEVTGDMDYQIITHIYNANGEPVVKATALWRLGIK